MFNANLTLNYGPMDKRASNGMIGETIGEGHYGLVIMGDTNVGTNVEPFFLLVAPWHGKATAASCG